MIILKTLMNGPIALGLLSIEILCIFILSFFIFKPTSFLKNYKISTLYSFKKKYSSWITSNILYCHRIFGGPLLYS